MTRDEALLKVLDPRLGAATREELVQITGWPARETIDRLTRLVRAGLVTYINPYNGAAPSLRAYYAQSAGDTAHGLRELRQAAARYALRRDEPTFGRLERAGEAQLRGPGGGAPVLPGRSARAAGGRRGGGAGRGAGSGP